jgi:hypothetical protein
MSYYRL